MGVEVDKVLKEFGERAVTEIRKQLMASRPKGVRGRQGNTIATGNLYNSIKYVTKPGAGGVQWLYIEGADYLKNVIGGRGAGKTAPPIDHIQQWIKDKGIKPDKPIKGRTVNRSLITYQKTLKSGKSVKINKLGKPKIKVKSLMSPIERAYRSLAFVISRSIKRHGIKPIPLGIAKTGRTRNELFGESLKKAILAAEKKDLITTANVEVKQINKQP